MDASKPKIIGGGAKKVLYTLATLQRIGLKNSAKALQARNTCKACGLGMGGQKGGMTNELGEFPAVCNKSIQAQSTDIQAPIPLDLFNKHPISDFKELTGFEIEHLGRLAHPIYKSSTDRHYRPITWQEAFNKIISAMQNTPAEKSFFYASGRSSNEAGFVLQLLARMYGTNNVNNCSYYCHQATGVGLTNSIGSGTATIALEDLNKCDTVFLIGANPASNHPRLIHKLKDLRERGGNVIVINPAKEAGLVRFAVPKSPKSLIFGGTEIASEYLQPKIGSDISVCEGIAKAILERGAHAAQFIKVACEDFSNFEQKIHSLSWCDIENKTGLTRKSLEHVSDIYANSTSTVFAWGMGITHHRHGVENVEAIANLALLRGMIGKPGAGLLPLRGHSNVQGIGTIGVKPVLANDIFKSMEASFGFKIPETTGMDTLACLESARQKAIDLALFMGGNLYAASPDSQWTEKAIDNIAFKVSLTTTLNHHHVFGHDSSESLVLPVLARDEETQKTTQESMFNYVRLSDGGIDRIENLKSESEILCTIGEGLFSKQNFDFNEFSKHVSIREAIAKCVPGMEQLKDIDQHKREFHVGHRIMHEQTFPTDNGRAKFINAQSPITFQNSDFPFLLSTIRSEGQFNTIIYENEDSYRGTKERWIVLMNKEDINELGLNEAARVNIQSDTGLMNNVKVVAFDLPRQNAMAYFPEANVLISRAHDPRSKTPAFKSIPVTITPAL